MIVEYSDCRLTMNTRKKKTMKRELRMTLWLTFSVMCTSGFAVAQSNVAARINRRH
jgi:hypothetical protein